MPENQRLIVSRRGFLKAAGLAAGGLALTGSGVVEATNTVGQQTHPATGPVRSGEVKVTQSYCHACLWKCGITVTTVGGRVVKLDGNPNNPSNRGKMCARGQAGVMELYDQDRLKTPLIRTGERGV